MSALKRLTFRGAATSPTVSPRKTRRTDGGDELVAADAAKCPAEFAELSKTERRNYKALLKQTVCDSADIAEQDAKVHYRFVTAISIELTTACAEAMDKVADKDVFQSIAAPLNAIQGRYYQVATLPHFDAALGGKPCL